MFDILTYIFDIVNETSDMPRDPVLEVINTHFSTSDIVKLPGYSNFYLLNIYHIVSQIYFLIIYRSAKLARNIMRLSLFILFLRNHYLSPIGLKLCVKKWYRLNYFLIELIQNNNYIMNKLKYSLLD
jgi:hypothetical protein